MTLSPSQLLTLRDDILADPTLNAFPTDPDGAFAIAAAYNLDATPVFVVWRTNVPVSELKGAIDWTEYTGLSATNQITFEFLTSDGQINAADPNIRQGLTTIFSGPQQVTTRTNFTELGKRNATRAEALFATGTGTTGSPGTLTFEGNLRYQDVLAARELL